MACRRLRPRWPESTGPAFPSICVAYVCFECFKRFRCILQLCYLDVVKVDRGVLHMLQAFQRHVVRFKMFHLFPHVCFNRFKSRCCICYKCFGSFNLMLQQVLSYCKYFFMLHVLHIHVAKVCSKYLIYFQSYVAFMLQVFYVVRLRVSQGLTDRPRGAPRAGAKPRS
jgi:hypothetical protein